MGFTATENMVTLCLVIGPGGGEEVGTEMLVAMTLESV